MIAGAAFRDLRFEHGILKPSDIQVVTTWPVDKNEAKVPSAISYATGPHGERQWGLDISTETSRLTLTKLQLEHQDRLEELKNVLAAVRGMELLDVSKVDQNNGLALSYSKDPEDIVADYLTGFREYLVPFIQKIYPLAWLRSVPIDLIITVPAVSIFSCNPLIIIHVEIGLVYPGQGSDFGGFQESWFRQH